MKKITGQYFYSPSPQGGRTPDVCLFPLSKGPTAAGGLLPYFRPFVFTFPTECLLHYASLAAGRLLSATLYASLSPRSKQDDLPYLLLPPFPPSLTPLPPLFPPLP